MPHRVRMPSLGQTTDELRIVRWLRAEGDAVGAAEPLLEVETDKATLEVEAVASGTLLKILHGAGDTVEAGSLLAYIGEPGEALPDDEAGEERQGVAAPIEGVREAGRGGAPRPAPPSAERKAAVPAARQLANEYGIDLALVEGSGPGGRIEKKDVLALIERPGREV